MASRRFRAGLGGWRTLGGSAFEVDDREDMVDGVADGGVVDAVSMGGAVDLHTMIS